MSRNDRAILMLAIGAVGVLAIGAALSAWGPGVLALAALLVAGGGLAVYLRITQRVAARVRPRMRPRRDPSNIAAIHPSARPASVQVRASARLATPLDRLQALTPAEFEEFVRLLFTASGLYQDVRRVGGSGDGGVDLTMRDAAGNLCVVQCKRYRGTVPAGQIRDLAGVMMLKRPREAFFVTTGRVSHAAQAVVGAHLIHIWDGDRLLRYAQQWLGDRLAETIERARQGTGTRS